MLTSPSRWGTTAEVTTQVPNSGFSLRQSFLATNVGANTALVCEPQARFLITAWCGRLDLWSFDPVGHIQGFGFPVPQGDERPELLPALLPPFAGSSPAEIWPTQLLPISEVAFASTGSFVTAAVGAEVRTFRYAEDRQELYESGRLAADGSLLLGLALSPDDRILAAISAAGNLLLWNLAESRQLALQPLPAVATSVCFEPSGSIWIGDCNGRVHAWDTETASPAVTFEAHEGLVHTISAEGGHLVTVGGDNTVTVWSHDMLGAIYDSFQHGSYTTGFAKVGDALVTASFDGYLAFWSLSDAALIGWQYLGVPIYAVAASPDETKIIAATATNVQLFEIPPEGLVSSGENLDWPAGLSVYRAVDELEQQDEGEELLELGMPEPGQSESAASLLAIEDGTGSADIDETPALKVSHSGSIPFPPDGATKPTGLFAPSASIPEKQQSRESMSHLPPEAETRSESDPMDGVMLHSSDLPSVEEAVGTKLLPPEPTGRVMDGVAHLLSPTELIIAALIGTVAGGVAWAVLFASDDQREVWVSAIGGVAAALTLFAGAMMFFVIRRIRRYDL